MAQGFHLKASRPLSGGRRLPARQTALVFVQEPYDATPQGMLLHQILSVISEYERTQTAERSRRGKLHRARQGSLNMLTRAPYGYCAKLSSGEEDDMS